MRRLHLAIGRALLWFIEPAAPRETLTEGDAEFARLRALLSASDENVVLFEHSSRGAR